MLELKGMLSLQSGDRALGGADRIELLSKIGETGSISAAARAVGMSYKGAWDAIDTMNNLADEPLVVRTTGGRHGGGTRLTPRGQRLIEVFRALEVEHQRFLKQVGTLDEATAEDIGLMRRLMIRTSARNQFAGTVAAVHRGAVNDTVELEIQGGQRLVAVVTRESAKSLGLAPGKEAVALIKASSVLVGVPTDGIRLSARNQLSGTVSRVSRGAVNAEVVVELAGGGVMTAIVTQHSVDVLGLAEGVTAVAIVKASGVILGAFA